jgi:hypothetical protein
MTKMSDDLYYQIRHLKTFRSLTGNDNGGIFCVRWKNGEDPEVFNDRDESINLKIDDIHMAEYIASLNNFVMNLIKEVESKYE